MHVLFALPDRNPDEWLPGLRAEMPDFKISVWDPAGPPSNADVALVWKPPAALFKHETGLKAVFNLGAGVDALLKMPEIPAHVQIVRLEDAGMSVQMAEYVLYALWRESRGFARYEADQAAGRWDPREGLRREQWPVGVLGLGVVGSRVAEALAAFEYPVAGWSRSPRSIDGVRTYAGMDQLPAFLARTRVLVNVLPLTPETEGILDRATLSQLLPHAHLINVGRGEHQNEDDILALLQEGRLDSVSLDVFRTEPLPAASGLWKHPRAHVTPHIAASTLREETIVQIADKIRRMARGEPLSGVVARERGY
ncbi:glyoxylate/hydroxypyruvate reductase A [Bordetella genomosp. 10]|uniref:Glyoxylate/hydroxypyruvate reductase A n=1 Tax=Bordetella genomosp. 10 TaxID=1416804 RepID=A0A261SKN6_9BORD|nr:glyoxylate/hydroxypyruvate reductase A [Bordetella genomosp. 10]OZI37735.1 glyoxylate/hydroxypyruvate reductase A [Bordetella genomosp. 10]